MVTGNLKLENNLAITLPVEGKTYTDATSGETTVVNADGTAPLAVTFAYVAPTTFPSVWVGGVEMTDGKYLDEEGDLSDTAPTEGGYAYYKDGVLTLHNFFFVEDPTCVDSVTGVTYNSVIHGFGDLVLRLEGDNNLENTTASGYGIQIDGALRIEGEGKLSLCAKGTGIKAVSVQIEGVTLEIAAADDSAIYTVGSIALKDADVTVELTGETGLLIAIFAQTDMTVTDSSLSVTSVGWGILARNKLSIADSTLTVRSAGSGIVAFGETTVTDSTVQVETTATDGSAITCGSSGKQFGLSIKNSNVTVVSQGDGLGAFGMQVSGSTLTVISGGATAISSFGVSLITDSVITVTSASDDVVTQGLVSYNSITLENSTLTVDVSGDAIKLFASLTLMNSTVNVTLPDADGCVGIAVASLDATNSTITVTGVNSKGTAIDLLFQSRIENSEIRISGSKDGIVSVPGGGDLTIRNSTVDIRVNDVGISHNTVLLGGAKTNVSIAVGAEGTPVSALQITLEDPLVAADGNGAEVSIVTTSEEIPTEYFANADGTAKVTSVTVAVDESFKPSVEIDGTISHSYGANWKSDATNHWYECTVCGHKKDVTAHTPGAAATETQPQTCTVCAYIITPSTGHTSHTAKTEWESDGTHHWHACVGCGTEKLNYAEHAYDNDCDTDCNECGKLRTVTHAYEVEWKHDETGHWQECSDCGNKINKADHTFSTWVVTKEATATEKGSRSKTCACGFTVTEEIPVLTEGSNEGPAGDGTPDSDSPSASDPSTGGEKDGGLGGGAIATIVVGSAVVAGTGGFAIWWFVIRKKTLAQLGSACKGVAVKVGGACKEAATKVGGACKGAATKVGGACKSAADKIKQIFTKK